MKQIKKPAQKLATKLGLSTQVIRPLDSGALRSAGGASGTLCKSGTPTVSSYNPTCF